MEGKGFSPFLLRSLRFRTSGGVPVVFRSARQSGGQILLVTAGEGRYQEKGKEIRILKPGDIVKIPPNVEHWHGAAPDSTFAHISIETNIPNNATTWLEPVTNKEYK